MCDRSPLRRIWKKAHLMVAFHVDRSGRRRDNPNLWSPKDGNASIHPDPDRQETIVQVEAAQRNGGTKRDVQIKLRTDVIALSRPDGIGWDGIVIEEGRVSVWVNGMWVRILADGSVSQSPEIGATLVSSDGAVLKRTDGMTVFVSPDGQEIGTRSPRSVRIMRPDGVFERDVE